MVVESIVADWNRSHRRDFAEESAGRETRRPAKKHSPVHDGNEAARNAHRKAAAAGAGFQRAGDAAGSRQEVGGSAECPRANEHGRHKLRCDDSLAAGFERRAVERPLSSSTVTVCSIQLKY